MASLELDQHTLQAQNFSFVLRRQSALLAKLHSCIVFSEAPPRRRNTKCSVDSFWML